MLVHEFKLGGSLMNEIILKHEEIDQIFKSHLKIESKVMSIDSIFSNPRLASRIDYKPYYQRNYVWDNEKATYFIESILIGTEIPPLVFFKNEKIEIIDGRQRYETIKNFIDKKLVLSENGLLSLRNLSKKNFDNLDEETKNTFLNTQIRILEFSVVNEPRLNDRKEDLIKKEIFRRYNSGITPLKKPEIERALFNSDDLTTYLKQRIKMDEKIYIDLLKLFLSERAIGVGKKRETIEKLLSKLRQMMVLHNVPIKKYSYGNNRGNLLKKLYDYYSQNVIDFDEFYKIFTFKISVLSKLHEIISQKSDYSNNKLVYECSFWLLNILEQENVLNSNIFNYLEAYADYICNHIDDFSTQSSHFYKNVLTRYSRTIQFLNGKYEVNSEIYVENPDYNLEFSTDLKNSASVSNLDKLDEVRLSKPEPTSMTIDDITRLINRSKFLIRPSYQRHEVINRLKSSALIESILLGIKLPPIFIFRRQNGVHEVIDGQQRLLTIIGFIGSEFIDEDGNRVKSEKNKYKLSNLRILSELNNTDFENLSEELKDKIYDFSLSVVIIDEKLNPNFDSIDLFIRLNNKPYPVKEHSFEMWNSYIDKELISCIKTNVDKHIRWFYLKKAENDKRMTNQELYATLVYLEHKKMTEGIENIEKYLQIYQRNDNINTRIKEKKDITKLLDNATVDNSEKNLIITCVEKVEHFISFLERILSNVDSIDLGQELNELLVIKGSKRTTQSFYSLWLILNQLNIEELDVDSSSIRLDIIEIMKSMKNCTRSDYDYLNNYYQQLKCFHERYQ